MWAVPLSHYHHIIKLQPCRFTPGKSRQPSAGGVLCHNPNLAPRPAPCPAPSRAHHNITVTMAVFATVGPATPAALARPLQEGRPPCPPTLDEHWIGRCPELSGVICILRDGSLLQHASRHPHRRPGLSDAVATCRGAGRYCVEDAVASTQVQLNQR